MNPIQNTSLSSPNTLEITPQPEVEPINRHFTITQAYLTALATIEQQQAARRRLTFIMGNVIFKKIPHKLKGG